jgi:hypothetical protein
MVLLMVHASVTEHIGLTAAWVSTASLHWCHVERVEYRQTCCKRSPFRYRAMVIGQPLIF